MILMFNLVVFFLFTNTILVNFYYSPSRFSVVFSSISSAFSSLLSSFSSPINILLSSLLLSLFFLNTFSSIPFSSSVSLYYFFTFILSITFWFTSFLGAIFTNPASYISHLMPYGSPIFLGIILPVIEIFSQLIRPFTLMVRLSTNLSAGHIILFMFSLFSMGSLVSVFPLFVFSSLLIILEMCISALQAYIFVSLASLYISETL